jgi:hypothetical protein
VKGSLRVILVVYCLLLAYCCLWVPWRIPAVRSAADFAHMRYVPFGYGWLWAGPSSASPFAPFLSTPEATNTALRSYDPDTGDERYGVYTPDFLRLGLRFVVLSTLGIAAFLFARRLKQ